MSNDQQVFNLFNEAKTDTKPSLSHNHTGENVRKVNKDVSISLCFSADLKADHISESATNSCNYIASAIVGVWSKHTEAHLCKLMIYKNQ